jgi:hypothetical protein
VFKAGAVSIERAGEFIKTLFDDKEFKVGDEFTKLSFGGVEVSNGTLHLLKEPEIEGRG